MDPSESGSPPALFTPPFSALIVPHDLLENFLSVFVRHKIQHFVTWFHGLQNARLPLRAGDSPACEPVSKSGRSPAPLALRAAAGAGRTPGPGFSTCLPLFCGSSAPVLKTYLGLRAPVRPGCLQ